MAFGEFYLDMKIAVIGNKRLMINGCIMKQLPGSPALMLLAMEEVTEIVNIWPVARYEQENNCFKKPN
jgi:two-component system, chemotaxis family, CheB/CheR fusion protein